MTKQQKDVRVYLDDILNAIVHIEEYTTEGKRLFCRDDKTQDAVIRQISIIGEAASKLPVLLRKKYKQISWKEAISMRNILIHEYSATNVQRVWDTVKKDLPVLKKVITIMLNDMDGDS
ncbi:MAG: DUF86 domain-containing protein [Patescibacteria group bacterium]